MRWAGHIACKAETRNTHTICIGKYEGKRLPRTHGQRWEDNIKTHLKKVGWEGMNWIYLAQE
jgi:hypothetical protein